MDQAERIVNQQPAVKRPKYRHIYNHLLQKFRDGTFAPHDALPGERSLAMSMNVAVGTLRQALQQLENEGFIRRIRGKGTFISDSNERISAMQTPPKVGTFALVAWELQSSYYPALLEGFEYATSQVHYQPVVSNSNGNLDTQARIVLQLSNQRVQGVAMVPVLEPTPAYHVNQLQKQGIPIVFIHRRPEAARAPGILLPHFEIGRKCAEPLLERGHRRIAFFTSIVQMSARTSKIPEGAVLHEMGVRNTMQEHGCPLLEKYVFRFPWEGKPADFEEEERACAAALSRWYSEPDPPTGIITTFDTLAVFICSQLRKMGLRVPEDVSVVGFGGKRRDNIAVRELSSVTVDTMNTGRRAAELLWEMHNGERPINDEETITIPLEWAEGQTIAPAASAI